MLTARASVAVPSAIGHWLRSRNLPFRIVEIRAADLDRAVVLVMRRGVGDDIAAVAIRVDDDRPLSKGWSYPEFAAPLACDPMVLERDLPAEPGSVRLARQFVCSQLSDRALIDDVEILVSEIATNAVLHARTSFVVVVENDGRQLRVEVRDGSPSAPVLKPTDPLAVTGRGLTIVDALASRWGVEMLEDGKAVWFEVDHVSDGLAET